MYYLIFLLKRSALAICLLMPALGFNAYADSVGELEQLVERWLLIERQISELNSNHVEQKNSMEQSLKLLNAEHKQLSQLTKNTEKSGDELAQKRADLVQQQNELELEQQHLASQLTAISQALLSLQVQLPPPLVTSWQAIGDLNDKALTLTDKLQMVLKMTKQLTDFQQRISLHEATIPHPDGQEVWVTQLYLGASQAWFVSKDQSYVGTGCPTSLGWQWQFDEQINSDQVAKAIAIYKKEKSADWVTLPIKSYQPEAVTSKVTQ